MRLHPFRWLWVTLVPLLLSLGAALPAWADGGSTLELHAPKEVTLGDEVPLVAELKDDKGAPIAAATIVLRTSASFLGTGGAIDLGQATTDAQGRTVFQYQARSGNSVTLGAVFPGDGQHSAAQASVEMAVHGSTQLYQQTAGVRLPGISIWLLVGVLGTVWAIYVTVIVLLALIATASPEAPLETGGSDA